MLPPLGEAPGLGPLLRRRGDVEWCTSSINGELEDPASNLGVLGVEGIDSSSTTAHILGDANCTAGDVVGDEAEHGFSSPAAAAAAVSPHATVDKVGRLAVTRTTTSPFLAVHLRPLSAEMRWSGFSGGSQRKTHQGNGTC